jgi:hypothetical protein
MLNSINLVAKMAFVKNLNYISLILLDQVRQCAYKKRMLYALFIILFSFDCSAGLLRIESNTFFAKRTGDDLKSETPLFEEFQTTYFSQEKKLKLNFDFNYSYDFSREIYNLDLNQLNIDAEVPDTKVHFSAGRSFETYHLIKSSTVDSLSVDYKLLNDQLRTGILIGVLRNYEFDKYSGKAPVYTWFSDYKTIERYPLTFGFKVESSDYTEFSRSKYQTVKTSLKKELNNSDIFFNYQQGLNFSESFQRELGINFYPQYDWMYGIQFQEIKKNKKEGFEQSIFNSFSLGKVQEVTANVGHAFSSKLYTGLSLSIDQYPVQKDEYTTGHKINCNINYQLNELAIKSDFFILKSFGGKAYGYNLNGQYSFNDKFDFLLENEWVDYNKITSAKNQAELFRIGFGTHAIAPYRIQALTEISSNNFYSEEWAFLLKLTFVDWREI